MGVCDDLTTKYPEPVEQSLLKCPQPVLSVSPLSLPFTPEEGPPHFHPRTAPIAVSDFDQNLCGFRLSPVSFRRGPEISIKSERVQIPNYKA